MTFSYYVPSLVVARQVPICEHIYDNLCITQTYHKFLQSAFKLEGRKIKP